MGENKSTIVRINLGLVSNVDYKITKGLRRLIELNYINWRGYNDLIISIKNRNIKYEKKEIK